MLFWFHSVVKAVDHRLEVSNYNKTNHLSGKHSYMFKSRNQDFKYVVVFEV